MNFILQMVYNVFQHYLKKGENLTFGNFFFKSGGTIFVEGKIRLNTLKHNPRVDSHKFSKAQK